MSNYSPKPDDSDTRYLITYVAFTLYCYHIWPHYYGTAISSPPKAYRISVLLQLHQSRSYLIAVRHHASTRESAFHRPADISACRHFRPADSRWPLFLILIFNRLAGRAIFRSLHIYYFISSALMGFFTYRVTLADARHFTTSQLSA
jgi:hypothetical protein